MSVHWFNHDSDDWQPDRYERMFVSRVSVRNERPARPCDRFIGIGWALIVLKCVLASLAIAHWSIPIADFYVWGPSFMLGGLCTGLYLARGRMR